MVFYRKYRSQTLEELVGQETVKKSLQAALASGKLAQAYLFCGPRGTGKTSTARILAKIVNCETLGTSHLPCNECQSCLSITNGSNMDVIEMDAASNRGIDDIRALRENIKLASTSAKKKVYIIDEVHMLSTEAFNALLKTLEEPPSHVLFILATTEVQKIPQTILSRVNRLDFKPGTTEELLQALKKIIEEEKIEIDEEALQTLAKKAQGSFRDAVKFLDLLAPLGKIDQKLVEQSFASGAFEDICSILLSIAQKDTKSALQILSQEVEKGANLKEVALSILDNLRQILLIQNGVRENLIKAEVGGDKYQILKKLAEKFKAEDLIKTITNFQSSLEQSRYVSIPSLPLEVAVVESCSSSFVVPGSKPDIQTVDTVEVKAEEQITVNPFNEVSEQPVASDDLQKIHDRWNYILEAVRADNFSLEALLKTSKLVSFNDGILTIEVPYSFHQRILEAPKSRNLLDAIFSDVVARPTKISIKIGQRPVKREEIANIEIAADDEIIKIASEIFNSDTVN